MPECTYSPAWATLSYGMTYNQAYTFDVVCPMLYSADYSENSQWVASNISYLKDLGYKTVIPSLQANRSGSTETLAADIKATLDAGCHGYLLFRTGTYDVAHCTAVGNAIELTYVRGTDYTCGNLTVTVSGVTPTCRKSFSAAEQRSSASSTSTSRSRRFLPLPARTAVLWCLP